jgi:glycosyltransferase involved in cell wall biosynthesis
MSVIAAFQNYILYPHKIIVIDNGSTDGTIKYLELMKELGFIHHLILNGENKGIAEPKNQGMEVVHEWAKTENIKYVCVTDNDIVVPFIRKGGCVLSQIVKMMDKNPNLGMVGVDLSKDNAPDNQEYWWRLRQHPNTIPQFAEIVIGFWFSVFRYEHLKEYKFSCASNYGKCDESVRNWLGIVKKAKIGVFKGVEVFENGKYKETESRVGIHLGWTEDFAKFPDYVNMKKTERFKAEQQWKADGRKY